MGEETKEVLNGLRKGESLGLSDSFVLSRTNTVKEPLNPEVLSSTLYDSPA